MYIHVHVHCAHVYNICIVCTMYNLYEVRSCVSVGDYKKYMKKSSNGGTEFQVCLEFYCQVYYHVQYYISTNIHTVPLKKMP